MEPFAFAQDRLRDVWEREKGVCSSDGIRAMKGKKDREEK
jgi:hypothetical protein